MFLYFITVKCDQSHTFLITVVGKCCKSRYWCLLIPELSPSAIVQSNFSPGTLQLIVKTRLRCESQTTASLFRQLLYVQSDKECNGKIIKLKISVPGQNLNEPFESNIGQLYSASVNP